MLNFLRGIMLLNLLIFMGGGNCLVAQSISAADEYRQVGSGLQTSRENIENRPFGLTDEVKVDSLSMSACHKKLTIKTNTLGLALLIPNLAVEYDIVPHLSVSLPFYYSGGYDYFKETIKFRCIVIQPELRYYPWLPQGTNSGFYLGAHLGLGWYNFALDGKYRYQDHRGRTPSYGGGLGIGYSLSFKRNPKWGMEFALGAGVYNSKYDILYNEHNGPYAESAVQKLFIGIDNASLAFIYRFDMDKKGGNR